MTEENVAPDNSSDTIPYKICEHIKDDGARCGGAALHGEPFCRFHVRVTDNQLSPGDPGYLLPVLETEQSVQIALQQMMAALLSGKLGERKAAVMLAGIKAAAALIKQAQANTPKRDLLNEIAVELSARMPVRPAAVPEPHDVVENDWQQQA